MWHALVSENKMLDSHFNNCDITSGEAKGEGGRHVPGGTEIRKIPKIDSKIE